MKVCKKCLRELPLEAFPRHNLTADGRAHTCRDCVVHHTRYQKSVKSYIKHGKKKYKWMCIFDEPACNRSATFGVCCSECSKKEKCDMACQNTPEKCGAYLNEQVQ